MSLLNAPQQFQAGAARIQVYASRASLGAAAAERAAALITRAIEEHGRARVIAATGNSQLPLVEALVAQPVDWKSVELFHMDEYAGMSAEHPSSFRLWIRTRLAEKVHPLKTHYLAGDAKDLEAEIARYSRLLLEAPVHLAFVGFGENGHIAFNDPPVADFRDPATVKKVSLDEPCRKQQAGEGHFPDLAAVPTEAVTITCTGLFRANAWVCCVPSSAKRKRCATRWKGRFRKPAPRRWCGGIRMRLFFWTRNLLHSYSRLKTSSR